MATYKGLGEKRTKKSTAIEKSGDHGRDVAGIAYPVTPSEKKGARERSIPSRMEPMPDYGENPFELNPQLKGFLQAKSWRGSSHFPVRPQRMKKDVMDVETRDR